MELPDDGATAVVLDRPTGTTWDYHVANIHARHAEPLEEKLKEMGQDGWELVFVHMPVATEYQCIFRKCVR